MLENSILKEFFDCFDLKNLKDLGLLHFNIPKTNHQIV
jgi:hypothetical protein